MILRLILILAALFLYLPVHGQEADLEDLVLGCSIDRAMGDAIDSGLINGGVVFIGDSSGELFLHSYGHLSPASDAPEIEQDTVFDLASLTKVLATAPSVMKLVEEGRVGLHDPLTIWFPEFVGTGKDTIQVFHLLTHTSGLVDFSFSGCKTMQGVVEKTAFLDVPAKPGDKFKYADINFILLGELVRRVSGFELDRYALENFYVPLGMSDTRFSPSEELRKRCASTRIADNSLLYGTVQDPNARALGGVAGHAGLFATAADLSRFCRMLLGGGEFAGKRVMTDRTVRQMSSPSFTHGNAVIRGLGWDILSPYSSPRCNRFSCASFGHTGYSGCSIWIDPDLNLFVGILVSRNDYRRIGDFNHLRGTISTLAANLFSKPTQRKCRENLAQDIR
ncbi:MAG: class A beta-lactamase-related serine hydrolase [Geobacter sp.]|nr:MAG: class A beta-lactamase-related serine hydrolase [Geobacter sp.]